MLFVFLPIIIVQALIILFFIIFTLLERSSIRSILDSADKIANKDVETEDIKISGRSKQDGSKSICKICPHFTS